MRADGWYWDGLAQPRLGQPIDLAGVHTRLFHFVFPRANCHVGPGDQTRRCEERLGEARADSSIEFDRRIVLMSERALPDSWR